MLGGVVLAAQVHADTSRPRARVGALRALEHAQVRVGAQPVLGHPRQEPAAIAVYTAVQLLRRVVAGDLGRRPFQALVAVEPRVVRGWVRVEPVVRGVRAR